MNRNEYKMFPEIPKIKPASFFQKYQKKVGFNNNDSCITSFNCLTRSVQYAVG